MSRDTRYAVITGVNGWVPEDKLTNADLEQMVETSDEWIRTRTGVEERRILKEPGAATSDMGARALQGLIDKTGIDPESIDLVICATVTPDHTFPDTANIIIDKCGVKNAYGYDVNASCSGFLFSVMNAAAYIESGRYNRVVLIGADKMSSIVDYEDRATCIIFGDGSGAIMFESSKKGPGIIDSVLRSDGSGRKYLHMKAGGSLKPPTRETVEAREHFIYQEGRAVFKRAVQGMAGTARELLQRNDLTIDDINWVVPHQANMRIITSVADQLDIPMERVMNNIHKYGNTTGATIPLCLWEWEDRMKVGDLVILSAFGGGFTWGSILLRWTL